MGAEAMPTEAYPDIPVAELEALERDVYAVMYELNDVIAARVQELEASRRSIEGDARKRIASRLGVIERDLAKIDRASGNPDGFSPETETPEDGVPTNGDGDTVPAGDTGPGAGFTLIGGAGECLPVCLVTPPAGNGDDTTGEPPSETTPEDSETTPEEEPPLDDETVPEEAPAPST